MSPRVRAAAAMGALLFGALSGVLLDAQRRRVQRDREDPIHRAVVQTTGLADLALSSSARWLRHPSQAEAGAAMSDLPASLDVDPAGAIIGPPRAVLEVGGVRVERR